MRNPIFSLESQMRSVLEALHDLLDHNHFLVLLLFFINFKWERILVVIRHIETPSRPPQQM